MALHFSYIYFPLTFLIICRYTNSTFSGKAQDIYPFFRVDSNGTIHRYQEIKFVPPSHNSITGIQSKDVTILLEKNVSARLYLPKIKGKNQKFPLLIYIHGGGFCIESAFSPIYDSYLQKLTAEANVVAVSVNYRLAPEHKIPACYDDSWAVMKWAALGTDPWLKKHVDFSRVYLAGDSAGANIAHNMMARASEGSHFVSSRKNGSMKLVGMALIDPYFGNGKPDSLWTYICPKSIGLDDPRFNPAADPGMLSRLNCSKILVCTLLVYVHGGAFCIGSAFSPMYDNYLHDLTAKANVVSVSVEYRLAPEHPIPACYDDSWAVMKWIAQGKDPWLKQHADFSRVFLAGESSGANIAHDIMVRASKIKDSQPLGVTVVGMALVDPFFGNDKPDKIWNYICPEKTGIYDPRLNPAAHPRLLSKLNCSKILVCTASKDFLTDRAWTYYETLQTSGWKGEVEMKEIQGEGHAFHLLNPTSKKAKIVMKWLVDFLV